MKKLCIAMAFLCLIVSVSSCTADDLDETLNLNEIQTQEIANPESEPFSLENGDNDDNKNKQKD